MIKNVYKLTNFNYTYDNTRSGAKYCYYDSLVKCYKWGNNGDISEVAMKYGLGLATHKDPNGAYDEGSDIEETHTSVKSWGFTLASKIKADSFEDVLRIYWSNVASTNFSFCWIEGDELIDYNMNADEFNQFLYRFAKYTPDRKTIRGPKFSNSKRMEVEAWLERRVG